MFGAERGRCAGCAKQMVLPKLTYDENGRLLCARCQSVQMSNHADRAIISADEYRSCEACGKRVTPELVTDGDSTNFPTRRRYACAGCGHGFWLMTGPALAFAGAFGALGAALTGGELHDQDLEAAAVPGVLMALCALLLLRDAWLRHRNPRAL